jgi:MEMO1 family protein
MSRRGAERPPAVAGMFYPGDERILVATVRRLLADADVEPRDAAAILVPHAGYSYSGPIAAVAIGAVATTPGRVVLVGPAHRVRFDGVSAADFSAYRVPTGRLPVDRAGVADLEAAGLARFLPTAHADEHCLEVMIPLLLERFGQLPILPLLVGAASAADVEAALARALRPGDLLLISSDLSHFLPYDEARRRDLQTLDDVVAGRWSELTGYDACGHRGLAGAMRLAARRGWRAELLDYRSSGDTAGDRARVVGYAAVAFASPDGPGLTAQM